MFDSEQINKHATFILYFKTQVVSDSGASWFAWLINRSSFYLKVHLGMLLCSQIVHCEALVTDSGCGSSRLHHCCSRKHQQDGQDNVRGGRHWLWLCAHSVWQIGKWSAWPWPNSFCICITCIDIFLLIFTLFKTAALVVCLFICASMLLVCILLKGYGF